MRKLAILTAGVVLVACTPTPDEDRSCAELARARANAQMERELALQEQHQAGGTGQAELQRNFIAMDAERYRRAVYEECMRRREQEPKGE